MSAIPVILLINAETQRAISAVITDADFTETILFGTLRTYQATLQDDEGDAFDVSGWQFRYSLGTYVEYSNAGTPVPAVVVASADVNAFSLAGANVLTWSTDCNTDEFLDAITRADIARYALAKAELWGRPTSSDPWQPLAAWFPKLEGSVFDVTQTPASSASTYYTAPQIDLMIQTDPATGDTWAMKSGAPIKNLTGTAPWGG